MLPLSIDGHSLIFCILIVFTVAVVPGPPTVETICTTRDRESRPGASPTRGWEVDQNRSHYVWTNCQEGGLLFIHQSKYDNYLWLPQNGEYNYKVQSESQSKVKLRLPRFIKSWLHYINNNILGMVFVVIKNFVLHVNISVYLWSKLTGAQSL